MRHAPVLCLLALAACASQPPAPVAPAPEPLSVETADYLWLEEGPCFGFCPSYRLTLTPGGYTLLSERVTSGARNGPAEGAFAEAQAALLEAGFADLPDEITPENPEVCPNPATDLPTAQIAIGDDEGYWRRVTYYQGCFVEAADAMVEDLRRIMRVRDLVDFGPPAVEAER